jgi:WD40 repeat protein
MRFFSVLNSMTHSTSITLTNSQHACFVISTILFISASHSQAAPPLTAVAFVPDGTQVVLGSQQGIEIRTWPEMAIAGSIDTEFDQVHDLRFSPDGKTLLAAGGSPTEQGAVEVLAWPSQKRVQRIVLHKDVVYRVAWSSNGSRWATASGDGTCSVVDAASGTEVARYSGHSRPVLSLEFTNEATNILSVGVDQTLRLWDSRNGEHLRTLDNHVGTINAIAVCPEKTNQSSDAQPLTVATISEDRTIRIWQPSIGRLRLFAKLSSLPRTLVWSADGDRIYVGCNDGQLQEVDPESLKILNQFQGLDGRIHEIAIDSSDRRLLVVGETGFRLLDLKKR